MEIIAQNKKARFLYEILEKYEAGLVLTGPEIKAVRAGRVNLTGSYIKDFGGELFLVGAHFHTDDPTRTRKLLLRKEEISHILGKLRTKGLTAFPLNLYLKKGKAKITLALGKGRKLADKRELLRERDLKREVEQELRGKLG